MVGFLLYRLLHSTGTVTLAPLDMSGYISLFPYFLLFCGAILTGSMALAKISLASMLALSALVTLGVCVINNYMKRSAMNRYQFLASAVVVCSNLGLVCLEQASSEGYFWMELHCASAICLSAYGRLTDARYGAVDRQYYSYIFSLVVLLPASLYLDEAFKALSFEQLNRAMFLGGSVACAVLGVALHFYQTRLRHDKRFGQLHHLSSLALALISLPVFGLEMVSPISYLLVVLVLVAQMFLPTHIQPDDSPEEEEKSSAQEQTDAPV